MFLSALSKWALGGNGENTQKHCLKSFTAINKKRKKILVNKSVDQSSLHLWVQGIMLEAGGV